jgi:hypothetical protein
MLLPAFAQVGTGRDAGDPHLAHMALHRFAVHPEVGPKGHSDASRAIEGMGGIDLIDPMFERHLFRRGRHALVVQPTPIQTQDVGLGLERERALGSPFDQGEPLTPGQVGSQIFF